MDKLTQEIMEIQKDSIREVDGKISEIIRRDCFTDDTELNHIRADSYIREFLMAMGFSKIAARYNDVYKWYA